MSESTRSKLPVVATVIATVAVGCAISAVVVVSRRKHSSSATPSADAMAIVERKVVASDVVALPSSIEAVASPAGVRVTKAPLATALGFEPTDVVVAINGRVTPRVEDATDAIVAAPRDRVTTLYIDTVRAGAPTLLRWRVEGDLKEALRSAGKVVALPSAGAPDPGIDTVQKLDELHYQVPRSTVDAWLADPSVLTRAAHFAPASRGGKSDGFKLDGIQPTSVIGAVGFRNGDVVHTLDDYPLETAEDAFAVYNSLKSGTELTFQLTRGTQTIDLTIDITR